MANAISPLQPIRRAGQFGTPGKPGVTIQEVTGYGLLQFSAWGTTLAQTGAEAARLAGCSVAPEPGRVVSGFNGILMRVEPLKWWLVTPADRSHPKPELAAEEGAVLDMQDARCWLRISGDKAETLLNHFLPLNLRPSVFVVGAVATTAFHHVGATLWRDADGLNLLLPRSSALSLWQLLSESAHQYGLIEE